MRPDLEMTDENTIRALLEAFSELNLKAYHYYDPQTLGLNAEKHKQDLVLSIYGGQGSRNRMALVPAICEINGIHYVGPDVYGRVICQDKEVSKHLANQCGLKTPEHRIIRGTNDLDVIRYFPTPFVVKPIMEGSSIGIGPNSLVHKSEDGIILAKELFESLRQPIMVEAFVSGREVSYNCIEAQPENLWTYSEIHVEGREDYFDTNLFDAEEKLYRRLPRKVRTIDAELSKEDRTKLNRLLETIGRFSYCRVDGKSREGEFVFLEITPDAWIAPTGAFAASFMNKGWPYADVIKAILSSVIINPHDQLASG
jgi:D-alanine-D-alanine ligase